MYHRFLASLLAALLIGVIAVRAQTPPAPPATLAPGLVLVAKVVGTVTMTVGTEAAKPLQVDMQIPQAAKINTANDGRVVLVFSNGATTQLAENSELVIQEFLQDPFADAIKVSEMTEEPSVSRTRLALNRGELVGDVKKLKHDRGSSFTIQTPVGAAGIRGTTFRIVFRPNGNGQAFFELSTAEGNVEFLSNNGNPPGVTGAGIVNGFPVPQGQAISFNVTVTLNALGQWIPTVVPALTDAQRRTITPEVLNQIAQVAEAIAVATQLAVFSASPPAAGGARALKGSTTGNGAAAGTPPTTQNISGSAGAANFTGEVSTFPTQPQPHLTPQGGGR